MSYNTTPETPLQAYNLSTHLEEGTTLSIPVDSFSKLHSMRNGVVAAFKRRDMQKHFKVTTSEKDSAVYITKLSEPPTSARFQPNHIVSCEPTAASFEDWTLKGKDLIRKNNYIAQKEAFEKQELPFEAFQDICANNYTQEEMNKWNSEIENSSQNQ